MYILEVIKYIIYIIYNLQTPINTFSILYIYIYIYIYIYVCVSQ